MKNLRTIALSAAVLALGTGALASAQEVPTNGVVPATAAAPGSPQNPDGVSPGPDGSMQIPDLTTSLSYLPAPGGEDSDKSLAVLNEDAPALQADLDESTPTDEAMSTDQPAADDSPQTASAQ
jgi:hypothetical protein